MSWWTFLCFLLVRARVTCAIITRQREDAGRGHVQRHYARFLHQKQNQALEALAADEGLKKRVHRRRCEEGGVHCKQSLDDNVALEGGQ